MINRIMIPIERNKELDFLLRIDYPLLVISGSNNEQQALEAAKSVPNLTENDKDSEFFSKKEQQYKNIFDDIYSLVELIYNDVFVIENIDTDEYIMQLRALHDVKLFNGDKVVQIHEKQLMNCAIDSGTLGQLDEYFSNKAYPYI